jgi:hypothetical protein
MLEDVFPDDAAIRKLAQKGLVDKARAEAPGLYVCAGNKELGQDGFKHSDKKGTGQD